MTEGVIIDPLEEDKKKNNAFYKIEKEKQQGVSREEEHSFLRQLVLNSKSRQDDYETHKMILNKLKEEDRKNPLGVDMHSKMKKIKTNSTRPKIISESIFKRP